MARSKRDVMKRSVAQAVNHLAHAILDVNAVYIQFDETATQIENGTIGADPMSDEDGVSTHRKYAEYLKTVMLGVSQDRDNLLSFALKTWGLSEDELIKYMQ